ncbi:prolyl oligopeptidase family serine peptidase [Clostridium beijerinckii]|uniref:prolyl oligopeptidase family serine peptidase n=1 Tax=Clostridium beijerinckii TaxID=1520 RepID=UPI00242BD56C|nr:prolyl oligopeptidase family serine peptidase [Clostridium beijerinckii]MDG5856148.1 prolyl oligopeptidase family serine peptidase [Clostridium beijerinckii]
MKNMIRKYLKTIILCTIGANMSTSSTVDVSATSKQINEESYRTVTETFDWGPAITKIIIYLGATVSKDSITNETFKIRVVRTENRIESPILGEAEGECKIIKAYVSDNDGNVQFKGKYVTLELEVGPDVSLTSPINYDLTTNLNGWVNCDFTIKQNNDIVTDSGKISGLVINKFAGGTKKLVDDFKIGSATYDNITIKYVSYTPENDYSKKPLIIWLHGIGEGGTDGLLPISGNKAVNFASKDIQVYFNGAYILVPQAQTFWMDGFNGFGDGSSKYEKALMSLIKDYVSKNSNIDTNRIYIGGDSNGGYMTMLMIRDYADYFAAAFPTCEALKDTLITDKDIEAFKKVPIWFTAAKTDTTVPPADYVVPTYDRLVQAGDTNVHFPFFDNVIDTTGLYKKADNTPYEYNGHWSWIYVYNNQCSSIINGKVTTLMEWLSDQQLNKETKSQTGMRPITVSQTITISQN